MQSKLLLTIILILLIAFQGCAFGPGAMTLEGVRQNVTEIQKDEKILKYASAELKEAENAYIAAYNTSNNSERTRLLELAMGKVQESKEIAKREAALGLSDDAWEQRRWLREVRAKRLKNTQK